MNRFFKKLLIFISPVVVLALALAIIDPYNFIFEGNFISNETKKSSFNRSGASMPRGNALWKAIEYGRKPIPNIIIGDSRGIHIEPSVIKELTGEEYYNLSVPGAYYPDFFSMFWYAAERTKLKNVYIQVGFHNFNTFRNHNLFQGALNTINKPYEYFILGDFYADAFNNARRFISGQDSNIVPPVPEWDKQTMKDKQKNNIFGKYEYPKNYIEEFKAISKYCDSANINLRFIIFPNNQIFHEVIKEKNLVAYNDSMVDFFKSLAPVYNYNFPENFMINTDSLFRDIYHIQYNWCDSISTDIWSGLTPEDIVRKYSKNSL